MSGYWSGFDGIEDLRRDFDAESGPSFPAEADVLFATYDCPDYEGDATVVYREGRQLYIVRASHCSCYGLENQWCPSAVSLGDLRAYKDAPYWNDADDKAAWDSMLIALAAEEQAVAVTALTGR